jgi:hypothetical protein
MSGNHHPRSVLVLKSKRAGWIQGRKGGEKKTNKFQETREVRRVCEENEGRKDE